MIQLLMILASAGAISGSVGGVYWGGNDGLVLGASSGLVFGVFFWFVAGSVRYAVREYRLNRYFSQDGSSRESQEN